jgi:hypothetical protein
MDMLLPKNPLEKRFFVPELGVMSYTGRTRCLKIKFRHAIHFPALKPEGSFIEWWRWAGKNILLYDFM